MPGNGSVSGYAIFENGHQLATTTDTHYTVAGLTADTSYQFTVAAIDSAGSSAQATPISVHTTRCPAPTSAARHDVLALYRHGDDAG